MSRQIDMLFFLGVFLFESTADDADEVREVERVVVLGQAAIGLLPPVGADQRLDLRAHHRRALHVVELLQRLLDVQLRRLDIHPEDERVIYSISFMVDSVVTRALDDPVLVHPFAPTGFLGMIFVFGRKQWGFVLSFFAFRPRHRLLHGLGRLRRLLRNLRFLALLGTLGGGSGGGGGLFLRCHAGDLEGHTGQHVRAPNF